MRGLCSLYSCILVSKDVRAGFWFTPALNAHLSYTAKIKLPSHNPMNLSAYYGTLKMANFFLLRARIFPRNLYDECELNGLETRLIHSSYDHTYAVYYHPSTSPFHLTLWIRNYQTSAELKSFPPEATVCRILYRTGGWSPKFGTFPRATIGS